MEVWKHLFEKCFVRNTLIFGFKFKFVFLKLFHQSETVDK